MLIAVAVLAAAVVGAVAWWLRRNGASGGDRINGDEPGGFEPGPERRREWELLLTSEAEAAFTEGLRAYHEAGGALRVGAEQGVLTTYEPPRLISLHLLADAFAARGDAALHDPQGTVERLLERLAATERPGVLHLRPGGLDGEVDGMDAVRFAAAVGETVRPGGWTAEARLGALQVTVRGDEPVGSARGSGDRPLTHVNGTPIKSLAAKEGDDGDVPEESGAGAANTMMLDLARVLDLYQEARADRPEAEPRTLLGEIVPRLIAAGGPGVTWARPPRRAELRTVLGSEPELH
ncbi:hypothetical protein HCN51_50200 [Nonomuraea sp. FMUSA5-5]|uniref:Uncharacterized protein n=1 Tax=Nonomuraea composti TaxID=2720023 RepID=A0ABX1BIE5_9ACTN|nr:hypothetical protein [Nonomuraea sp. FMUSA5-5]NJP97510.1 hypothetical protein [Nonomuraea sp. FMUSA5-5]